MKMEMSPNRARRSLVASNDTIDYWRRHEERLLMGFMLRFMLHAAPLAIAKRDRGQYVSNMLEYHIRQRGRQYFTLVRTTPIAYSKND
jgi:hypothetical protein